MSLPSVAGLLLVTETSWKPLPPESPDWSLTVTFAVAVTSLPLLGPSGFGLTDTAQFGGVVSIRIGPKNAFGFARLPALSLQPPLIPRVLPAAVTVNGGSTLATPDWLAPSSVQLKLTVTAWFVQVPAV